MALSEESSRILVLLFSWVVYILLGLLAFKAVEDDGCLKNKSNEDLLMSIKQKTAKAYNMTEAQFDNIARQILSATTSTPQWSYAGSLSFVIQLLTTIGYGNLTPTTSGGRVLCIFYAFFGIPLTILLLQLIGEKLLHGEQVLVTAFERRFLKREETPRYLNEKCFFLGLLVLVIILTTSAAIHMKTDEWTFLEGFYCFFITYTTVGFGDFIPGRNGTAAHLASRIIFIIIGLVAMSNVLNALAGFSDTAKLFGRLRAYCESRKKLRIVKVDDAVGTELNDEMKSE